MKKKKFFSCLFATVIGVILLSSCNKAENNNEGLTNDNNTKIKTFTAFFTVPGKEINDDNEIQAKIAEITGAKVKEVWLTGQTKEEAEGTMIAGGEYPDFLNGSISLYEADALVALDDYLDKYPNVKNFYSDEDWDRLRQDDGHIYWIPQFSNPYSESIPTEHPDEAVWIQTRVLEWANYPDIETYDEYWDLLESYIDANPSMEDGTPNIAYTILTEDWRYFCLENAGMFLDGYPNDGLVNVDLETLKVIDYNTSPTSKRYFKKLNEEYNKGYLDPESFTQTYDEYIAKLSTGRVLGMIDQWWNFSDSVNSSIKQQGLDAQGCNYVPLPITIDKGIKNQWHVDTGAVLNVGAGLSISKDCDDIEGAMEFLNGILSDEVLKLRYWGIEGVDYEVDENGLMYRTEEQRFRISDPAYKASHLSPYSYFLEYVGLGMDGKNAVQPKDQPSEFLNGLPLDVQKTLEAYGHTNYADMLGVNPAPGPWYPLWSFGNTFTTATPGGLSYKKIDELKHAWLPKVSMAPDFEAAWEEYMKIYAETNPEPFLQEVQEELDRRIEMSKK